MYPIAGSLSVQKAVCNDRKMYEQKILFASNHDALTGLYNRVHFEAYVRDLRLDEHQAVTVAFGDVNGLRILNEAFGREEGDRLLRRIAQIMLKSLRREDYVSRVGGDEFALILFDRTEEEISSLLSSLMAEISSMEMMGSVKPTISFGVSPHPVGGFGHDFRLVADLHCKPLHGKLPFVPWWNRGFAGIGNHHQQCFHRYPVASKAV